MDNDRLKSNRYPYRMVIVPFLFVLLFLFVIGSVYAIWDYSLSQIKEEKEVTIELGAFKYGIDEAIQKFEDDLNEPDSLLNKTLKRLSNLPSFLKQDFVTSLDTLGKPLYEDMGIPENISFVLQQDKNNPDIKYLYTTDVIMGTNGNNPNIPYGEKIYRVYRTVFHKQGDEWKAENKTCGSADSYVYEQFLNNKPFFDWNSWREEQLGTEFDNAVCTFIGQKTTAIAESNNTFVYYKIKATDASQIKVSIEKPDCMVIVYDQNRTETASSENGEVTFSLPANVWYYLAFKGDEKIPFETESINI